MKKKNYTFDEAYQASLDYFKGDELAAKVWVSKYALKDSQGLIYEKSPEDMHWRLAKEVARIEKKYANPLTEQELFDLFDRFTYIIPQGSPMTGIGNNYQVASLSNCFVIGMEGDADSYGAIIRIDEEQVQLMKRRGGVGHDLSTSVLKDRLLKTQLSHLQGLFHSWSATPILLARWLKMVAVVPLCLVSLLIIPILRILLTPRWSRARLRVLIYQ